MSLRFLIPVAAAVALAAQPARAQSFSIEGFGGYQNLDIGRPAGTVANAVEGNEGTAIVGGQVLAGLGPIGVGALVDKTVSGNLGKPWSGAVLAGLLVPLSVVRLELLGELGRRAGDFGDVFNSTGQTYVGVRPGVSFRLAPTSFIIGVSGMARWPTSHGDFGSPTYGIVGRIGLGTF
jgi:hypothetical protein